MAGHSHWAGIKHKKGTKDAKRGALFSKLLNAISVAARDEPNQDFNPRLRTAVQKARERNVPQENIERAINRAREKTDSLEELLLEAYGPGGSAILIEAISDNRNRTIAEIKNILAEHNAKFAERGGVRWAFSVSDGDQKWNAKFTQTLGEEDKSNLKILIEALENQDDVQNVYTNAIL